MTETMPHPVDLALRAAAITLEPSRADFDYSRAKLTDAIAAGIPHQRTKSRRSWAIGLALFVVVAVLLVQTVATSPAAAVITEIAEVVQVRDPLTISDSQFAYIRTEATRIQYVGPDVLGDVEIPHEQFAYLLPVIIETWVGDEGTVRLQETNHDPQFFSTAAEQAYYAAELDEGDQLEKTVVTTQADSNPILEEEDWPTDPSRLETMIRTQVGDDEVAILNKCLEFLRAPLLPPELRAAVLQVVAGLDLELVDESDDGGGTFSAQYELEELGLMRLVFTLNATGHLTFEELVMVDGYPDYGIPAGIAENRATHSVPVVVDSLP